MVNLAEQSKMVFTDEDGNFSISDANYDDEVNAKCVGYLTAITPVENFNAPITIVLQPDNDPYSHEVAVAFDTLQKKLLTDSRSVVSGEELQRYPVTVLRNSFSSLLPGVQTYEWSSEPGWSETTMYVRGLRTMNTNARSPLIIVDNVERDLSFLDAFPIESVTVLKDAAASALYGMRGANGVILVTTKRGEAGKTHINFTQEVGFRTLCDKMEVQDSYNMTLTRNQVRYLSGMEPMYSPNRLRDTVRCAMVSQWKECTATVISIPTGLTNSTARLPPWSRQISGFRAATTAHATTCRSHISVRRVCGTPNGQT